MFIEPRFVVLVALCWITLSIAPARFRPHTLAVWGVAFYALFAPQALWLVAGLTLVAFVCVGRRTKWVGIALLVGLLAYFKRPVGLTAAGGAANRPSRRQPARAARPFVSGPRADSLHGGAQPGPHQGSVAAEPGGLRRSSSRAASPVPSSGTATSPPRSHRRTDRPETSISAAFASSRVCSRKSCWPTC